MEDCERLNVVSDCFLSFSPLALPPPLQLCFSISFKTVPLLQAAASKAAISATKPGPFPPLSWFEKRPRPRVINSVGLVSTAPKHPIAWKTARRFEDDDIVLPRASRDRFFFFFFFFFL
ncbi:hypothetical protein J3458_004643 [Metarhizium acridum]|uniref:uncharacterized protein n=1 Tax=Metarhizium acridum TaxID=92637 RepID=UPI001C6CD452|nr:hypothetical protein J3458_004643 [Metarhizium acridum]